MLETRERKDFLSILSQKERLSLVRSAQEKLLSKSVIWLRILNKNGPDAFFRDPEESKSLTKNILFR